MVNAGGGCRGGGWGHTCPFFPCDLGGSPALRRHDERRGGEGLDTAISIWKVEACIDELNWGLWPPSTVATYTHTHTHTHTQTMCFVAAGKDVALNVSFFFFLFLPLSQLQRRHLCGRSQLVSVRVRSRFRRARLQNQWVKWLCCT